MDPEFESELRLLIGIDFGTTFSGVAWKLSTDEGSPDLVGSWPSRFSHTFDAPKVPSAIHYGLDSTGPISWGYNIPPGVDPLRFFKLLLLEEDDLHRYVRFSPLVEKARAQIKRLNKDPIEVIADYLRELWRHAVVGIKEAKGDILVDSIPFHVVVTVPAIWTDYARDRMRKAVEIAGICELRLCGETKLSLVSEPEAAALSALPEFKDRLDLTVDVITYKVDSVNPLTISEAVKGDGALCGAIMVDQEFETSLKEHVGAMVWDSATPYDLEKVLNNEWENGIKKNFSDDTSSMIWHVDFPQGTTVRHPIDFTYADISQVFERSITQTRALVLSQMEEAELKTGQRPKLLLLVGGYGQSRYLYDSLRSSGKEIVVLRQLGQRPWAAICRGAVTLASLGYGMLNGRIEIRARVARQSYGWSYKMVPFNPALHEAQDQEWDPLEQTYAAVNQMHWIIKRGQHVQLRDSGTTPWFAKFNPDITGVRSSRVSIWTHNGHEPPSGRTSSLRHILDLEAGTPIPVEQLELVSRKSDNGRQKRYRKFDFDLRFEVSGASVDISVISGGRTLATKYLAIKSE